MLITFVKKIKEDGQACRKCAEVETRLTEANLMAKINRIVVADERDLASEGMVLADQYAVTQAPFFLVEKDGITSVYTSYLRLIKEVFDQQVSAEQEAKELLEQNPNLDFI